MTVTSGGTTIALAVEVISLLCSIVLKIFKWRERWKGKTQEDQTTRGAWPSSAEDNFSPLYRKTM